MEDVVFEYGECVVNQNLIIKLPANKYCSLIRKYVDPGTSLADQSLTAEWGVLSTDCQYRVRCVNITASSSSDLIVKINEYKQEVLQILKTVEDLNFDIDMDEIVKMYGAEKLEECFEFPIKE